MVEIDGVPYYRHIQLGVKIHGCTREESPAGGESGDKKQIHRELFSVDGCLMPRYQGSGERVLGACAGGSEKRNRKEYEKRTAKKRSRYWPTYENENAYGGLFQKRKRRERENASEPRKR